MLRCLAVFVGTHNLILLRREPRPLQLSRASARTLILNPASPPRLVGSGGFSFESGTKPRAAHPNLWDVAFRKRHYDGWNGMRIT